MTVVSVQPAASITAEDRLLSHPATFTFIQLAQGRSEPALRGQRHFVTRDFSRWLATAISTAKMVPLPSPLSEYGATVNIVNAALVMTLVAYGPPRPGAPTGVIPLATFGVAPTVRQGAGLWQLLCSHPEANPHPDLRPPVTPWCGVIDHPGLAAHPETAPWLAQFERAVAWTWIDAAYDTLVPDANPPTNSRLH